MKPTGYFVMEECEDYTQALCLRTGPTLPKGGILDWQASLNHPQPVVIFPSRADAVAAINRTEHYRLAFGLANVPEKRTCRVHPVVAIPAMDGDHG